MRNNERTVVTTIYGSDDGSKTFEISRVWDTSKKIGIVIELYPTISVDDVDRMDLSTMHLMNHVRYFGWGGVRIVNIFGQVFEKKPLAKELVEDKENYQYIKGILSQKDISDADIVIAWGSALSNNKETIKKKLEILELLQKKKQIKEVMCIESDFLEGTQMGVHPLYLGLHHAKEEWRLVPYPLEESLNELLDMNDKFKVPKKKVIKEVMKDVLQTEE